MTGKIFRNAFLVGIAALLLCGILFLGIQSKQYEQKAYEELAAAADYVAHGMKTGGEGYLHGLQSANRITWIAQDGTVLYDSAANVEEMRNEAENPEIQTAQKEGSGKSIRASSLNGEETVYYAKKLSDGSILRTSSPKSTFIRLLGGIATPLLWVLALVLVLAGVLSFRLTKQLLRPINDLNLDNPDANTTYSELAPLVGRLQEQNLTIRDQMDELSRRQKEFATLTDSMSEGFLLIDRKGSVLSGNQSALTLLKCQIGDDLLEHGGAENAHKAVRAALEDGQHAEKLFSEGTQTWQLIVNPILTHRQSSGAVILIVDVTEREQRERLRQEFSANVSHELKTPLTSISGFAELMMEGLVEPEKEREFAGDIYRESRRLITLLDDIINLSRLDENDHEEELTVIDLRELTGDVFDSLKSTAADRNVTLTQTGEPIQIEGVEHILWEMIYNLCDNAIKYNRDGGTVTVLTERRPGENRLCVRDTGIGIPYAEQNRVFERFYRVDKSHSKEIGGTGLGLSIVKHGAQYHNARVELESTPGEGTAITLIFPDKKEEQ